MIDRQFNFGLFKVWYRRFDAGSVWAVERQPKTLVVELGRSSLAFFRD